MNIGVMQTLFSQRIHPIIFSRHFVGHWSELIFASTSLYITAVLIFSGENRIHLTVHSVFFFLPLWIAKRWKVPIVAKYVFCILSFLSILTAIEFRHVDLKLLGIASYFIPLLYACVLADIVSSGMAGIMLAIVFFHNESRTDDSLVDPLGVILASILYGVIFYLIRYLSSQINSYHEIKNTDPLTGLSTLNYTMQVGQQMIDSCNDVTVVLIDLNNFKSINDTFGHVIGNALLVQFAQALKNEMAGLEGIVGRLGGDEFLIVVKNYPHSKEPSLGQILSDRLLNKSYVADPNLEPISIPFVVGETHCSKESSVTLEELIYQADTNMLFNKYRYYNLTAFHSRENKVTEEHFLHLIHALEEKDMYTYVHSQFTAQYSVVLAEALYLPTSTVEEIRIAGLLHDIGKLMIPNKILRKPRELTAAEFKIIKQHVTLGLTILENLGVSEIIMNGVKYHHERWDGSGYPFGLTGSETPIEGRILQLADAFSAMTIKRVYRECLSVDRAVEEMLRNSGNQFDSQLVKILADGLLQEQLKTGPNHSIS